MAIEHLIHLILKQPGHKDQRGFVGALMVMDAWQFHGDVMVMKSGDLANHYQTRI